jgi:hypothetical protein
MADSQQTPPSWRQRWGPLVLKVLGVVLTGVLSAATAYFAKPDTVVTKTVTVERVVTDKGEYAQTFGWYRDEAAIADNLDAVKTIHFANTPAGKAVLAGDADVYLWRAVTKAAGKGPNYSCWIDQGPVGCCVGAGTSHAIAVLLAVQVVSGAREEFQPVSAEVIYGGSRVEVGGGRLSGDGSVGSWAAKWCHDYGVVAMRKYDSVDLSTFSPTRARQYGRTGCPDVLEPLAKQHPVKSAALVQSWADVKKAVSQGYPVAVCSNQGFTMARDDTGRCRPQGVWNHCMAIIGVRGGANEGGYVVNSWGPTAHTGPRWPADAPPNGFWADAHVIDHMVKQNDSFAYSGAVGFPSAKLDFDWFIHNVPRRFPNFTNGVATR